MTLILLIVFFAVNGAKIFRSLRKVLASMQKQGKKTMPAEPVTMANPNTESPKMRRNVQNNNPNHRTSSIFTVSGTEYETKTVSTPISRHPAEDNITSTVTTDFSYDNRALQLTPVNEEKPKTETNF